MEQKTTTFCYTAPETRVITVAPARCIAGSSTLTDMDNNPIFSED